MEAATENLEALLGLARMNREEYSLVAQMIRVANSASYGAGTHSRSIEQAVTRMGAQKVKTLLIEVSARQLFESPDRRIGEARGLHARERARALLTPAQ